MFAMSEGSLIGGGIQIANRTEIASRIRAAVCDLRSAIESRATAHHHRADRLVCMDPSRQIHRRSTVEIKRAARESKRRFVQQARRKNVRFTEAGYLFSQGNINESERIIGGRIRLAVVGCVDGRKRVLVPEYLIEPHSSKVLANPLRWIAERFGNSARRPGGGQKFRSVGHGPQSEQRLDARDGAGS